MASTTATADTGDTAGSSSCPGVCIDPPPDPWHGPLATIVTEDPAGVSACTGEYPEQIASFGHTLVDPDAPCECSCDTPTAEDCIPQLSLHETLDCSGPGVIEPLDSDCDLFSDPSVLVDSIELSQGCKLRHSLPTPTYDLHTVMCEGQLASGCEGEQQCAALPDPELDPLVCYWAPGELDCPEGFPERRVVYADVDDQRSCSEGCACSGSPTCSGGVNIDEQCDFMANLSFEVGECISVDGSFALLPDVDINGACSASTATVPVMGELVEDEPQTVCCRDAS